MSKEIKKYNTGQSEETEANNEKTRYLSGVFTTGSKGFGFGKLFMVGWTCEGKLRVTENLTYLTPEARKNYSSGINDQIRQIPFQTLIPVEYNLTGEAQDLLDRGDMRTEDRVVYLFLDQNLSPMEETSVGELTLLSAIVDANLYWQNLSETTGLGIGQVYTKSAPMYNLLIPVPEERKTAYVVLFKPLIPGESNEETFKKFIRNTLGRLLILDETERLEGKSGKGYIEAAAKLAGISDDGKIIKILRDLQKIGYIEFADDWIEQIKTKKQHIKQKGVGFFAGAMRILKDVGWLEDTSDEDIERMKRLPLPSYDLENISIERLFELARAMKIEAEKRFHSS